jgi:hypothetical protein
MLLFGRPVGILRCDGWYDPVQRFVPHDLRPRRDPALQTVRLERSGAVQRGKRWRMHERHLRDGWLVACRRTEPPEVAA